MMNTRHEHKEAIVITSISSPNAVLHTFAETCQARGIGFIVIGDSSSPVDFELAGCDFWSLQRQQTLSSELAKVLPHRHYARKNLGYLIAAKQGAEVIIETDDDNYPLENFWEIRSPFQKAEVFEGGGWINVYRYFSDTMIWPRGFPLECVQKTALPSARFVTDKVFCPIQQGLVNENPDVDAIYRLLFPLPQSFSGDRRIALGKNSWCPFNSQNTIWFRETFPLLYLPSTCSFRMTDIWRSFVAQRICHEKGWHVLFTPPTVRQERNKHNLMVDFSSEVGGYVGNRKLCEILGGLDLGPCAGSLSDAMTRCYANLIEGGFFDAAELRYLEAWLNDIPRIDSISL